MSSKLVIISLVCIATASGFLNHHYDMYDLFQRVPLPSLFASPAALPPNVEESSSYCFRFTWLGGEYTNETFPAIEGKKCEEIFAGFKPSPLCVNPPVVTWKGKPPDTHKMYANGTNFLCKRGEGQVCAKFSYILGGIVQNVTRYCTHVTVDERTKLTHGCLRDTRGSYTKEVCACISDDGSEPCNSAQQNIFSVSLVIGISILIILRQL